MKKSNTGRKKKGRRKTEEGRKNRCKKCRRKEGKKRN
jgi:hypothetical protein